jgi:hypothetical protein
MVAAETPEPADGEIQSDSLIRAANMPYTKGP